VVGTVATLSAVVQRTGWSLDAALVAVAGTGLTFGMWWIYWMLPSARVLEAHRDRSFVWGYSQLLIVASIVATGAGLHVAALYIDQKAHIGPLATVLSVAIPVGVYVATIYALYWYLVRRFDPFHVWLLSGTGVVVGIAVIAALAGVNMAVCLVVLMLAPAVTVVGYEMRGHRHQAEALAKKEVDAAMPGRELGPPFPGKGGV
jgi:low temperature requirement protein LtrA